MLGIAAADDRAAGMRREVKMDEMGDIVIVIMSSDNWKRI